MQRSFLERQQILIAADAALAASRAIAAQHEEYIFQYYSLLSSRERDRETFEEYTARMRRLEKEMLEVSVLQLQNNEILFVVPWAILQNEQGLYFIDVQYTGMLEQTGTSSLRLARRGNRLTFATNPPATDKKTATKISPGDSGFAQIFLDRLDNPGAVSILNWDARQVQNQVATTSKTEQPTNPIRMPDTERGNISTTVLGTLLGTNR